MQRNLELTTDILTLAVCCPEWAWRLCSEDGNSRELKIPLCAWSAVALADVAS